MHIYHLCQCCDQIFKITPAADDSDPSQGRLLTGDPGGSIINPEFGSGVGYQTGLCEECREEVYGTQEWLVLPHRLH